MKRWLFLVALGFGTGCSLSEIAPGSVKCNQNSSCFGTWQCYDGTYCYPPDGGPSGATTSESSSGVSTGSTIGTNGSATGTTTVGTTGTETTAGTTSGRTTGTTASTSTSGATTATGTTAGTATGAPTTGTGTTAGSTTSSSSGTTGSTTGAACSPTNYTQITNAQPMPLDFCAYAGLPFRAPIPASPQNIDQPNTTILQQQYIPNSGPSGSAQRELYTDGEYPLPALGGSSQYVVYVASLTDPLVTVKCSSAMYGCSQGLNPMGSIPAFHIPAAARPSFPTSQNDMEIIQPDGNTFSVSWQGCNAFADFVDGGVIGGASDPCAANLQGVHTGNILTGAGVDPGNINGGDDFAALPAHYNEVIAGQINHALVVTSGCFTGTVYPGFGATQCSGITGIPSGAHLWLNLTHAQIDALPTSTVPVSMRVFLYAAHDYGIYTFDTGDGTPQIGEPMIEDPLPQMIFGGTNPWIAWFNANGGSLSAGDGTLKTWNTIDWRPLAANMFVLDVCYAHGNCSDSLPAP